MDILHDRFSAEVAVHNVKSSLDSCFVVFYTVLIIA